MKEIVSTKLLKEILKQYYQSLYQDSQNPHQKVAWCSSVGPSEILISIGFKVYFPENHGALLGATRESNKYISIANAMGYSPEICSYLTSDVGAFIKKETPLTKAYGIPSIPEPDVLVYSTNQCREIQDWFLFYSREYNVPAFGVFPPWKIDELTEEQIGFVEKQFKSLINSLEKITGKKLDIDRLKEVVSLSGEASKLWRKFLETAKNSPSPITFFDGCIHMAPVVMLRGTNIAVEYYKALNEEIAKRVDGKVGAIEKENLRFYWEGMPVWGKLRFFSELFSKFNTCVVASTYCNSWIFDNFSSENPLRSLAEGYTQIFINRSETKKEALLKEMIDEYKVDGIVFHDAKTCPNNSNSRFGLPQRMIKKFGIPYLIINGDLNDLRCFSEEQTITAVESFVEQIIESKKEIRG
ncbi:MAG: 2-hydroxyacyl-CoA dehydratase family protein [Acidobacteriota bacterium]